MTSKSSVIPRCPSAEDLERVARKWESESQDFIYSIRDQIDDAEIFIRHQSMRGWRFASQSLQPLIPPIQGECYIRLFRGGHTVWGRFPLSPEMWRRGSQELIRAFPPNEVGFYRPPQPTHQHPRPTTFDPRFHHTLGEGHRFQRLAYAISDNTWHEGDRLSGIHNVEGRVLLHIQHRLVTNLQGSVSDSKVHIESQVRINHCYEDSRQQIFCPSSFLPWALMGSTLWRKRSSLPVAPPQKLGFRPIILAPRLLERIFRQRLLLVCTGNHFDTEAQVGNPSLTLTHEPKIDGMVGSSPFDDLGRARESHPMIFQGILSSFFVIDPLCAEWSPQGPRPQLSNFFIRPGRVPHSELMHSVPDAIQVENAEIEPMGELGPNAFTLKLTEAITADGELISPNRYRLSGTLASTAEGPGLLESIELSREVVDTGTCASPFARCQLYLHPI